MKELFRRFTFLSNLFPSRELNLADAEAVLSNIVADAKAKKKPFDQGEFSFIFNYLMILPRSSIVDYSQTRDMNIVVSVVLIMISSLSIL